MTYTKDLSIVISLFNEEESLPELISWIEKVMAAEGYSYEVIMVDDGSRDGSWSLIKEFSQKNPSIKGISFRRNYGKSPALASRRQKAVLSSQWTQIFRIHLTKYRNFTE